MQSIVFLDRDGTLNVDRGFVHRVDQWELLPGVINGLRMLRDAGFLLAVVTNQSGVGRGRFPAESVDALHAHMRDELRQSGVDLAAVAYCPHRPDAGCLCRKPAPGMAFMVQEELVHDLDYTQSWMIGDKPSDAMFGENLGMKTALLASPYWTRDDLIVRPNHVCDSLLEAARWIVAGENHGV